MLPPNKTTKQNSPLSANSAALWKWHSTQGCQWPWPPPQPPPGYKQLQSMCWRRAGWCSHSSQPGSRYPLPSRPRQPAGEREKQKDEGYLRDELPHLPEQLDRDSRMYYSSISQPKMIYIKGWTHWDWSRSWASSTPGTVRRKLNHLPVYSSSYSDQSLPKYSHTGFWANKTCQICNTNLAG